jgi:photosystem II stability/assembly factor-like uncharacterized protein
MAYLLVLFPAALAVQPALAAWRSTGPFGGDAELVRVVPKVPGLVIAGAHNGLLFISRNGGAFWTNIPFAGESSGTLHALEVDPRFEGTWYAGVEGDHPWTSGVYKTTDAGVSWTLLDGTRGKAVWSLALFPTNPDLIVAGTGDGVYRSADGGKAWARISPEGNQELRPVVSLAFDPTTSGATIYAGTTHLPWRTTDGGAEWESIHAGMIDDSDVFSIQVDAEHHEQVYASACSGLYQSSDQAAHWSKLATPVGAFRTYFVALDPHNTRTVFAGTTAGLLRSEDGGHDWREVTQQAVRSIAFDAQLPSRIYFASSTAGLMVSTDGGRTLHETNAGFTNRNFAALTGAKGMLYASSVFEPGSGGIYRSNNYGLRWERSATEPGQDIRLLASDPDQPQILFAAGYHGLYKSTDGGKTWRGKASLSEGAGHITALLALPRSIILAATDQGLFRSTDGVGWQLAAGTSGGFTALALSGEQTVSALSAQGAFASTDAGVSWKKCGEPSPSTVWNGLAFDSGAGAATALAATSIGLFRSADSCHSWEKVLGLQGAADNDTVSIVLFHPTHPGEAFVAQGGKVFRSTDQGRRWLPVDDEGRGLAWPSGLMVLPQYPERLFALFPRRGVLSNNIDTGEAPLTAGSSR